jgi:hypothetical protein
MFNFVIGAIAAVVMAIGGLFTNHNNSVVPPSETATIQTTGNSATVQTGQTASQSAARDYLNNLSANSDLLGVEVKNSSGQALGTTPPPDLEQLSMPKGTPFEVSWQVSDSLAASNPVCELDGSISPTAQPTKSVGYSGTVQVSGIKNNTAGYMLRCKVGAKTYTSKEIIVNFQ